MSYFTSNKGDLFPYSYLSPPHGILTQFRSFAVSNSDQENMDQDDSAGFGSYMPFRFPAFSASTAVDFSDNTMDMSILPLEHRAFHTPSSYNSDTALDFSTDESVSPSSHTSSSMFDMTDPPIVPDMNGYDPMYFDGRSLPLLNTILPGAPVTSSSISDLDYLDDNSHVYVAKAEVSMDA